MNKLMSAFLLALTLAAGPALAHTDEYLDKQSAPNGGQLRMAGPFHLELVIPRDADPARESEVSVYVTDHAAQPARLDGASARAIILSPKGKAQIELTPAAGNRLTGSGRFGADDGMIVVVSFTPGGGGAQQARFEPMKRGAYPR